MKKINVNKWNRKRAYEWFKSFNNSTYSMNVRMDVTKLVEHTKKNNESFFIDFMYIVLKGLNSIDEMKMRLVDDNPVIYDDINPAFTVMTQSKTYENVRHKNYNDFKTFYKISSENIKSAKEQNKIKQDEYNPVGCYNEYYITCTPWVDFIQFHHPIPEDKASQCIPRICWGKYTLNNGVYELTLNITVSHVFVDGYPLSKAFNLIQDFLYKTEEILK